MSLKLQMFMAKVLIIFSVILIIFGTFLQFKDKRILDPKNDVTILARNDRFIAITPVDKDDLALLEEVKEQEDKSNKTDNGVATFSPIPSIPNGDLPSFAPSIKPEVSVSPSISPNVSPSIQPVEPTPSQEPVVEDNTSEVVDPIVDVRNNNNELRRSIEDKFGIIVKFGDETSGYSVGGMGTEIISDVYAQQNALTNLNNSLTLYPSGFFQEIKNGGYPLTIYLIKRYSKGNVTGVTDSTYKKVLISVASDYSFNDTLHHELYHYIEKFIFSKGFRFTSWNTLNPSDFNYGVVNGTLSYSRTYSADSYFVNNYAQTDQFEDRASTFEYMMMPNKASCLNNGKTIWLKAKTMSEQIDFFLNSVSSDVTEYWERHIYS